MAALQTQTFLSLGAVGIAIALFLISVLYNSLILWVTTKLLFKLPNARFKTALIAALAAGAIDLAVGIILKFIIAAALGAVSTTLTAGATLAAGLLNLVLGWAAMFTINSLTARKLYKLQTGKSFLIGLVWTAAAIIIGAIIGLITAAIIVAVALATVKPVY
ncbi:hypothetical protein HYU17_03210 [Candidatus Woesearchaeota archaeon]|nr:hypothetical protein [Candidatus Woesearchaeota archaeon]